MPARPQDSLGRFTHADGTPAPPPVPGVVRRRGPQQIKHFRVDAILSDEERAEYERLLARPTTTIKDLQAFLRDRGHRVCRSAVTRHRRSWNSELRRLREVSRMAASFCQLTREHGAGVLAEASHARFEMMLMQSLFKQPGAEQMPADEWQAMSKTVQGVVATRRSVEEMRTEFEQKAKQAVAEAERAAHAGATMDDVVERVRQILG